MSFPSVCVSTFKSSRSSQLSVPIVVGSKVEKEEERGKGEAEDPISQVKDVSRDVSKWRASSLRNPGIKDLGHVLRRIPKLSAKRKRRNGRREGG